MRWNQLGQDIPKARALSDILCGAAMADGVVSDNEQVVVRAMLLKVLGAQVLPAEVESHLAAFDASRFDMAASLAILGLDAPRDRKAVLKVAADIVKADQVLESAERDYLHALAGALGLDFADAF